MSPTPKPVDRASRAMILLSIFIFTLTISGIILKITPSHTKSPFVLIFALFSLLFLGGTALLPRKWAARVVSFNLFVLFAALTVGEIAARRIRAREESHRMASVAPMRSDDGKQYIVMSPRLGAVHNPNNHLTIEYPLDNGYREVHYTIDEHGLRITPQSEATDALLFFGCSQTFGHKLNDEETFPYLVGLAERERYKVYNFSGEGQGPHNMLASIRAGRVHAAVGNRRPVLGVYFAISDHPNRVLGRDPFNFGQPAYTLEAGRLVDHGLMGPYQESQMLWSLLRKSNLFVLIDERVLGRFDQGVALSVELVRASRDELRRTWPEMRFVVLLLDGGDRGRLFAQALQNAGVKTYVASVEIPMLIQNKRRYTISKDDGHFNAEGSRLIADYLISTIDSKSWVYKPVIGHVNR